MHLVPVRGLLRRRPAYQTLNRIELDQAKLIRNVERIQHRNPAAAVIPVLKGNAYGHGIVQVARMLNDAPCALVAVDGYFEAGMIRHITKHSILVMGHILPSNVRLLDTKRCAYVVQDIPGLHAFGKLGKKGQNPP